MLEENTWPMRRKDRQISEAEAWQIVQEGQVGLLSLCGPGGEAYAVPISYVLMQGKLYLHSALAGRKLNYLRAHPQVCFVVVGPSQPVYQKNFTTLFESAVLDCTAIEVDDEAEKTAALMALCQKYLPGHMDKAPGDIQHSLPATLVLRLEVNHISGKAKR